MTRLRPVWRSTWESIGCGQGEYVVACVAQHPGEHRVRPRRVCCGLCGAAPGRASGAAKASMLWPVWRSTRESITCGEGEYVVACVAQHPGEHRVRPRRVCCGLCGATPGRASSAAKESMLWPVWRSTREIIGYGQGNFVVACAAQHPGEHRVRPRQFCCGLCGATPGRASGAAKASLLWPVRRSTREIIEYGQGEFVVACAAQHPGEHRVRPRRVYCGLCGAAPGRSSGTAKAILLWPVRCNTRESIGCGQGNFVVACAAQHPGEHRVRPRQFCCGLCGATPGRASGAAKASLLWPVRRSTREIIGYGQGEFVVACAAQHPGDHRVQPRRVCCGLCGAAPGRSSGTAKASMLWPVWRSTRESIGCGQGEWSSRRTGVNARR